MGVESQHHRRDRRGDEDHEPCRIGDGARAGERRRTPGSTRPSPRRRRPRPCRAPGRQRGRKRAPPRASAGRRPRAAPNRAHALRQHTAACSASPWSVSRPRMPRPDAAIEAQIAAFTRDVQAALGDRLRSLALYGSAAGEDWIANRSDLNVAIVVARVTPDVLEALVPVVARWRGKRFALPLIVDHEYLEAARDAFPMELDDIRRRHRVLAGADPFATLVLA